MTRHPAKYTDALLPHFKKIIGDCENILDPFAGTGKLKEIYPQATLLEIEPEWAKINNAIVGDATNMPNEWEESFDVVCTSPCYGNRMADSFNAKDNSKRNTYQHSLGRKPSRNSSATLQWGEKYKQFHKKAWAEVYRVLSNEGKFVLNISDHIRAGKVQQVTEWHIYECLKRGFVLVDWIKVETPRNKFGANRQRVDYESILVFKKTPRNNTQANSTSLSLNKDLTATQQVASPKSALQTSLNPDIKEPQRK